MVMMAVDGDSPLIILLGTAIYTNKNYNFIL